MDIARPDLAEKRRRNRALGIALFVVAIAAATVGLARLKPAAPAVDRSILLMDTVKRGSMLREVRGNGTLVPEQIISVPATSPGRVERILLLPGVQVARDTVIVELSNPDLIQAAFDADSAVQAGMATLEKLKVQLESDELTQEATVATLKSGLIPARIEAESDEKLREDGLVANLTAKKSRAIADEMDARLQIELRRLEINRKSAQVQISAQEVELTKLRKQSALKQRQVDELKVKAGFDGVLQSLGDTQTLQAGQQLLTGANIARIANPAKLKAEIKIPETQAKDITFGQKASVDTRNGLIAGHVVRIDPAVVNGTVTVDVALDGSLPKGARPDLSVEGTVTLEKLENVLYVTRPVNGQSESKIGLFKVVEDGRFAVRIPVSLGRTSVSFVEIISGLAEGEQIILSDMSQWDSHERVRLN